MKTLVSRLGGAWRLLCLALAFTLGLAMMPATSLASISPDTLKATVYPGGSVGEHKIVHVPAVPPKADVLFVFDLTGSMGGTLADFKAQANTIMSALTAMPGTDFTFGVSSHDDYPGFFSSPGYADVYGQSPDYAYRLNQSLTANTATVSSAVGALALGYGGDYPEDYTRVLYESYADPNVGWRPGARRIVVELGDSVPHDNNINEGLPGSPSVSTGGDPGRDGIIYTGDDLDLQTVLAAMKSNGVTLLHCTPSATWSAVYASGEFPLYIYWDYWSRLTGGSQIMYTPGDGSFAASVENAITSELTKPTVSGLHLELSPGYGAFAPWITALKPTTAAGLTDEDYSFDITYTAPPSAPPGLYSFKVRAIDDAGVVYGEQSVAITVPKPETKVGISVNPIHVNNGDAATWSVSEANTGDTALTSPYVNVNSADSDAAGVVKLDASSPNFSGDGNNNGTLDPGEVWKWTLTEHPTASEHYWAFGHGFDGSGKDVSVATGHLGERADATLKVDRPDTDVGISVSPSRVNANDLCTWSITETNTGDVGLTAAYVNVNDADLDVPGIVVLNSGSPGFSGDGDGDNTLDPGEAWKWTFTEHPAASEHYWAFGHGTDALDADVSAATGHREEVADAALQVDHPNTKVGISVSPAEVDTGDLATWSVTETNTGDVALTAPYVNVNDANADSAGVVKLDASSAHFSGDTNHNGTLDPGEVWKWTLSEHPTASEHYWAFGHGTDALGADVSAAAGHPDEVADAALRVDHPDTELGISVSPTVVYNSQWAYWSITETNTGDVGLAAPYVNLIDHDADGLGGIKIDASWNPTGDTNHNGTLDPGEAWTWKIGISSTRSYHFWAFGHGTDAIGRDVSVATGHQEEVADAAVTVLNPNTKVGITVNPAEVDTGDLATWSVTETNTGDATLTAPYVNVNTSSGDSAGVVKLDASSAHFSGDDNNNGKLDPGEVWKWTLTEHPTASEHYWAFGHGTDALGNDISAATGHREEVADAALQVDHPNTKVGISVSPAEVDTGDLATWSVTETNTGDVALTAPYVNVNDANADSAGVVKLDASSAHFSGDTNHNGTLDPGEAWKWTLSEHPTASEHYWAFGHGTDAVGADVSVAAGYQGEVADAALQVDHPNTKLTISVSPTIVNSGGLVTWKVTEENLGDVALSAPWVNVNTANADSAGVVKLSAMSPNFSGDPNGNGTLDPGEAWTWTLSEHPTADEHYWAFGHGIDSIGRDVSVATGHSGERADATMLVARPDTVVSVRANPRTDVLPGGLVTWTVTERNAGNVALTGAYVNVSSNGGDNAGVAKLLGTASTTGNHDTTLDVGETWTWTLTSNAVAATTYTANGHGFWGAGDISAARGFARERDTDSVTVQKIAPDTEVHISANPTQVAPRGAVTLTVTERNTGNVALTGVYVNVSNTGADIPNVASLGWSASTTGNHDATLDVGETWTWTLHMNPTGAVVYTANGHGYYAGTDISYQMGHFKERDFVTVTMKK